MVRRASPNGRQVVTPSRWATPSGTTPPTSDAQTLRVIAVLWNRHTGDSLPESGWSVEYAGIPLSMEERRLLADEHRLRATLGVTSRPALLAKLDGITEDQARDRLREYAKDAAEFGGVDE